MHPCSLLPPQSVLHPNTDMPNPLLCNAHSPTPLLTRSRHLGTNPKVVIQGHRVCPDQVLGLSVVVGPARGTQPDLRPVQVRDWPAHDQHWLAASKSFLEGPVEAMMMIISLYSPDEGDVSQGTVSLLDISVSDNEDTRKHKAHEVARKNDTNFTAWKDKLISDGMTGLQE